MKTGKLSQVSLLQEKTIDNTNHFSVISPASDSTSAIIITKADGVTPLITINTSESRTIFSGSYTQIIGSQPQTSTVSPIAQAALNIRETSGVDTYSNITLQGANRTPGFLTHRSAGTIDSPTATAAANGIGIFQTRGYDGTVWASGTTIQAATSQQWTASAHGAYLSLSTTADNTTTTITRMTIAANGDIQLPGSIQYTNALSTDHTASGDIFAIGTVSGTPGFGTPVYISASDTIALADADSATTMPAIGVYISNNQVLYSGVIRDDSWTWTVGGKIYVSQSGTLTQTAPSASGTQVQIVGIAITATRVLIVPDKTIIEIL